MLAGSQPGIHFHAAFMTCGQQEKLEKRENFFRLSFLPFLLFE
jgi:hypothetical protein